jgi:hypothetical protein
LPKKYLLPIKVVSMDPLSCHTFRGFSACLYITKYFWNRPRLDWYLVWMRIIRNAVLL